MGRGSDPVLRERLGLQARICRLFDEQGSRAPGAPEAVPSWVPPVDIFETSEAVVLLAELPGVDPAGIGLELGEGRLTFRGQRTLRADEPDVGYQRMERPRGSFERIFPLSAEVDGARARAVYRDGILRVTLPKATGSPRRAVTVPVEG